MARTHPAVAAALGEHIPLPGCPQIIVTRAWAHNWLREALGFDPRSRVLDYMAFGRRETAEPLTDLSQPHIVHLLAFMQKTENP